MIIKRIAEEGQWAEKKKFIKLLMFSEFPEMQIARLTELLFIEIIYKRHNFKGALSRKWLVKRKAESWIVVRVTKAKPIKLKEKS